MHSPLRFPCRAQDRSRPWVLRTRGLRLAVLAISERLARQTESLTSSALQASTRRLRQASPAGPLQQAPSRAQRLTRTTELQARSSPRLRLATSLSRARSWLRPQDRSGRLLSTQNGKQERLVAQSALTRSSTPPTRRPLSRAGSVMEPSQQPQHGRDPSRTRRTVLQV